MSKKYKSAIVEMQPVRRADGGMTYIPQRHDGPDAGELMEIDPVALASQQMASQPVQEQLRGSYKDRAIGFSIKTHQLSIITGLGLWLLAKVAAGVALLSVGGILVLIMGFSLIWMASFILDLLLSPAGVAWYNSRRLWQHLDREQTERHKHYGRKQ